MKKIDIDSLSQNELDALNSAIKARMERIGKLKAEVQAVSDLVTAKGWNTLEEFLREAGYAKIASKGRAGRPGNASGATRRRLTKDEKKELERLLKAGAMTVREIADKFSVSQTTVMVTKSKLGLVKKRSRARANG
jgi:hypothetical protein